MGGPFYLMGLVVVLVALTGALCALTPWLMRKQECFAVTVPESAQRDARLVSFKHRYTAAMAVVTVVDIAVMAGAIAAAGSSPMQSLSDPRVASVFAWGAVAGCLAPAVASFCLMLHYRSCVQAIKREEGWSSQRAEAAAFVFEGDVPGPVSLAWNLLYVPVICATAAIGVVGYPSMPDPVPMHVGFAGNVTDYASKSPGVVAFPVLVQVFLFVCFVFCHWQIMRSKRPIDPARPATSALAYGVFARAQSVFLLVVGLLMSAGIGATFMMSSLGWLSLGQAALVVGVLVLLVLVGAVGMAVVYGQSGARVMRRLEESGELRADDDEHWKLGILYWNPDDASVFLLGRFGIGWTVNLARPAAWAMLVGFVVLTEAFVLGVYALVGL